MRRRPRVTPVGGRPLLADSPPLPTYTQVCFFACMVLIGPLFAACGAWLNRGDRREQWRAGLASGAAAWAGWMVSGGCAALLFPKYPISQYPPERYAVLFTVPGFLTGWAALLFFLKQRQAAPGRGAVLREAAAGFAALSTVTAVLFYLAFAMTTVPTYRALPWSAANVQQYYASDPFLGDFTYYLKARMPQEEFEPFVAKLGLTPHAPNRVYPGRIEYPGWSSTSATTWWTPSESDAGTFVHQDGDCWILAKYEKGWVFVHASSQ